MKLFACVLISFLWLDNNIFLNIMMIYDSAKSAQKKKFRVCRNSAQKWQPWYNVFGSRLVYPPKKINFQKQSGHVARWRQLAQQGTKCSLFFVVCCVTRSFAVTKQLKRFDNCSCCNRLWIFETASLFREFFGYYSCHKIKKSSSKTLKQKQ